MLFYGNMRIVLLIQTLTQNFLPFKSIKALKQKDCYTKTCKDDASCNTKFVLVTQNVGKSKGAFILTDMFMVKPPFFVINSNRYLDIVARKLYIVVAVFGLLVHHLDCLISSLDGTETTG